jgi:hypothetical protein
MFTTYILPWLERACLFDGGDDPAVADSDENAAPPSEKDEDSESS